MVELFFFLFWLHENCGKTPLQELKESEEGAASPPRQPVPMQNDVSGVPIFALPGCKILFAVI